MIFSKLFESPKKEQKREFKVGDLVKHPFRDENVPILFLGLEIYVFINRAYLKEFELGKKIGTYEAIDGSESFISLESDSRFVKRKIRSEPSAEIDFTNDVEQRTLVVPISELSLAK